MKGAYTCYFLDIRLCLVQFLFMKFFSFTFNPGQVQQSRQREHDVLMSMSKCLCLDAYVIIFMSIYILCNFVIHCVQTYTSRKQRAVGGSRLVDRTVARLAEVRLPEFLRILPGKQKFRAATTRRPYCILLLDRSASSHICGSW